MSNLSVILSASVERGLRESCVSFATSVVGELHEAGVLSCSLKEALKLFAEGELLVTTKRSVASKAKRAKELSSKVKKAKSSRTPKPEMILPFCGEIVADWCCAVRLNHGLHTQCTNGKVSGSDYCKTCSKAASNSATDKPPYGDIRERAQAEVLSYRDPKGRQTQPYANVAEKLKLDLQKAVSVASARGWQIPAEHLVKRSVKRGRPGKSAAVSDTDSDSSSSSKKKKKKLLKVKKAKSQSDLIAKLVAEAGEQLLGEESSGESEAESVSSAASTASKAELKAAKKAKKEAAKAAKLAEKEAAKAAKLAEKEAAKAAKLAEKEAAKATKLAEKEAAKAAKLAEKEAAKAAKDAEKEAAKAAKDAEKAAKDAEKEAAKAAKDAEKEAAKAAKEAAKAAKDAEKAAKLAEKEAAKAAKDAEKEAAQAAKAAKELEKVTALKAALSKVNSEHPILTAETSSKEMRAVLKAEKLRIKEEKAAKKAAKEAAVVAADAQPELDEEAIPSCESESEEEGDEEKSVDVVEMEIDGVTYLYDKEGSYAGVPHLLLTQGGDPIGTYDLSSGKIIYQDFEVDEEEE